MIVIEPGSMVANARILFELPAAAVSGRVFNYSNHCLFIVILFFNCLLGFLSLVCGWRGSFPLLRLAIGVGQR